MKLSDITKFNFTPLNASDVTGEMDNQAKKSKIKKPTTVIPNKTTARISTPSQKYPSDKMTQIEKDYWTYLNLLLKQGDILRVDFEPEKLRLAKATFYEPDFRVLKLDGTIEFHETKGFWRDDARVKIKVAAQMHPYIFIAVTRSKGIWKFSRV